MNEPTTIVQPADQDSLNLTMAAEEYRSFRLTTALPVEIFWRGQGGNECEGAAVLRELSAQRCRIDTQKSLEAGSALTVRVGANYLNCIIRDVELASHSHGLTAKLQILPTRASFALLSGLERLLTATAASRVSGGR